MAKQGGANAPPRKPDRLYPFPEALHEEKGRGWTIKEAYKAGHGATDLRNKRMTVPLDDDAKQANVRVHEMCHAAWSESDPTTLANQWGINDPALVAAAEDMRINYALVMKAAAGEEVQQRMRVHGLCDPSVADEVIKRVASEAEDDPAMALSDMVQAYIATIGTPEHATLCDLQRTKATRAAIGRDALVHARTIAANAWAIMDKAGYRADGSPVPTLQAVRDVCAYIQDQIDVVRKADEDAKNAASKPGMGDDESDGKSSKFVTAMPKRMDAGWSEKDERDDQKVAQVDFRHTIPTTNKESLWGEMFIEHPPLEWVAKVRIKGRRRKSDECGVDVRSLDRMLVDGRVFGVRRRVPGGTVLIDNSGSMGFTARQVKEIMEMAPAATIAFYEGNGTTGRLVIAAKRGKIMDENKMHRIWGDNTVDGPALVWLAGQAAPRYWVSDFGVTGVGGGASSIMLQSYCRVVMARANIKRLDHIEEVREEFKALVEA